MAGRRALRIGMGMGAVAVLAGCMEGAQLPAFLAAPQTEGAPAAQATAATVARDVEAPEVFELRAEGLWDGRPSLGGIWVAHASVDDPQRVVIRNLATGQSVNGALFRRERDNPGPPVQVSAEAAGAIGLIAGQPASLEVVALKRVEVPVAPAAAPTEAGTAAAQPGPDDPRPRPRPGAAAPAPTAEATPPAATPASTTTAATITAEPLDPLASAARAVAEAEAAEAAAAAPGALARPWLQVGMFTTEQNAQVAAERLTAVEMPARVAGGTYREAAVWRVLIGPAADRAELRALTEKAKALGYADAYPVAR